MSGTSIRFPTCCGVEESKSLLTCSGCWFWVWLNSPGTRFPPPHTALYRCTSAISSSCSACGLTRLQLLRTKLSASDQGPRCVGWEPLGSASTRPFYPGCKQGALQASSVASVCTMRLKSVWFVNSMCTVMRWTECLHSFSGLLRLNAQSRM